ncbi:MAG: anti-sigma factor family protein [Streptosporangiaceae bacterium]
MTHLGQRLSALIDGELDLDERERVLVHMTKCGSCRDEVAALRMLKRRMNALGDAAAGAGLTGRLMSLREAALHESLLPVEAMWPPPPAGGWPPPAASDRTEHDNSDNRAARFFIAGSLAVFLVGLSTAAVVAGGEPQARAPAPPVAPSVDVVQFAPPRNLVGGQVPASRRLHPDVQNVRSLRLP